MYLKEVLKESIFTVLFILILISISGLYLERTLFVGFVGVLIGTFLAFLFNFHIINMGRKKEIDSLIKAMFHKLKMFRKITEREFKDLLFNPNSETYLNLTYCIEEDYFTVYQSNSNVLGSVDDKLATKLISAYTSAKIFNDVIRVNNVLLEDLCSLNSEFEKQNVLKKVKLNKTHMQNIESHLEHLEMFKKIIIENYNEFISETNSLFKLLDNRKLY